MSEEKKEATEIAKISEDKGPTLSATGKTIVDHVLKQVMALQHNKAIVLPENYVPQNALAFANLMLIEAVDKDKRPVLQVCTNASIAAALLRMVIQGMNPAKNQCYFVAMGKTLSFMRSYNGTTMLAKRIGGITDPKFQSIYKGDTFKYAIDVETATTTIVEHVPNFENRKNENIIGCYAICHDAKGNKIVELMTIDEIEQAWKQGYGYKEKGGVHEKFRDRMCGKTVKARMCNNIINSSDDADLYKDGGDEQAAEVNNETVIQATIDTSANTTEIGFAEELPAANNTQVTTNEPLVTQAENVVVTKAPRSKIEILNLDPSERTPEENDLVKKWADEEEF